MKNLLFSWGGLVLDGSRVTCGEAAIELSHKENRLLRIMLTHRSECLSREEIYFGLTGRHLPSGSRSIDVHISALNRKIRTIAPAHISGNMIESVRNTGYLIP